MGPEEDMTLAGHKHRRNCLPSGAEAGLVGLIFDKYLLSLQEGMHTKERH